MLKQQYIKLRNTLQYSEASTKDKTKINNNNNDKKENNKIM